MLTESLTAAEALLRVVSEDFTVDGPRNAVTMSLNFTQPSFVVAYCLALIIRILLFLPVVILSRPAPLPVSNELFTVLATMPGSELVGKTYAPLFNYFQVRCC